jgi:hypothetical protein
MRKNNLEKAGTQEKELMCGRRGGAHVESSTNPASLFSCFPDSSPVLIQGAAPFRRELLRST